MGKKKCAGSLLRKCSFNGTDNESVFTLLERGQIAKMLRSNLFHNVQYSLKGGVAVALSDPISDFDSIFPELFLPETLSERGCTLSLNTTSISGDVGSLHHIIVGLFAL